MIPAAAAARAGPRRRLGVRRLLTVGLPLLAAAATVWAVVELLQDEASPSGLSPAAFADATGIELVRVAMTAGGGAIDVRFRVEDAAKASSAHAEHSRPVVIDQDSGAELRLPFSHYGQESGGGLHRAGREYTAGRTYYHLITNSEGLVERGARVTVVFGQARLADVVVQ